uniref:Uncharacterized protein n=1 Tax=Avena sativa TaxID=4498 RepID=A0ACD5ZEG4_AVESA
MARVRVANDKVLMELVVAVLIMCGCGLVVTPAAAGSLVPALYVFGDSTMDVGNNGPLPLPYGIDFPHHSTPTGRASNGYNVADSISRLLGFDMSPPAYLSLTPQTSREILRGLGGVNYACRGSGILDETGNKSNSLLTMTQQVEFFAATKSNMTEEYAGSKGSVAIDTLLSQSLFLISTGGNDMVEFILKPGQVSIFYAQLLSSYTKHVQTLYSLGARRFGILDVPPIGCVPAIRAMSPTGECVGLANALAKGFNYLLGVRMARLAADPEWSEMTYSIGSSYNLVTNFTADPEAAGFRDVATACCGDGRFGVERWCQANSTVCENRNDHLYWDGLHSSQATADKGAAIIFATPVEFGFAAPVNFKQLISSTHALF